MRGGLNSARRAWVAKRAFGVAKTPLIFASTSSRTVHHELPLVGNVLRAPFGTGKRGRVASAASPAAEEEEEKEVLPGAFK